MPIIDDIRRRLKSGILDQYQPALNDAFELSKTDWKQVLYLALEDFPDYGLDHVSGKLIGQLEHCRSSSIVWADVIREIERVYDRLAGRIGVQSKALRVVAHVGTQEAMAAVLRLLAKPSSEAELLVISDLLGRQDIPEYGRHLFPRLLDLVPKLKINDRRPAYALAWSYHEATLIDLNESPAFTQYCLSRAQEILAAPKEGMNEPTRWQPLYELAALLAVFQHLLPNDSRVDALLKGVVDQWRFFCSLPVDYAPRLPVSAICSLVWRGGEVAPSILESMAESPGLRWRLYEGLHEVCKPSLFPNRFRNQKDLAEADMVMWIEDPNEWGIPPQEIELLTVRDYPASRTGKQVAFFFKYRHADFCDGQWFVGMAGPYPAGGPPIMGSSGTYSKLRIKLDDKPLEEHVKDYMPTEGE